MGNDNVAGVAADIEADIAPVEFGDALMSELYHEFREQEARLGVARLKRLARQLAQDPALAGR